MFNNLPIYEFLIDENEEMSGVKTISLVEDPAMMTNFIAFEGQEIKPKYIEFQSYEQVVLGIALQPDIPIYRLDEYGNPYYGVFSKETIKKIVHKFHKEQQTSNVNLDHNSRKYIDAYMFSDYIVDSEMQIEYLKIKGIADAKIGSWVVAYKIEDEKVFEKVLSGEFKGFSVESFLDLMLVQMQNQSINKKIKTEMKKSNKTLLQKIISLFKDEIFERALVAELGFEIEWQEVGQPVNKVVVDAEGNETLEPVGAGEFKTEEGIVVVDESSNLLEVRELPEVPEVPEVPELPLDGEFKDYPWDQCISDQLAAGYTQDVAEKICGYIKEKNMSKEQLTDEILKEILGDEECLSCKEAEFENKLKAEAQKFENLQAKFDEIQKENDNLKAEIESLKKDNNELNEKLKAPIGDPVLEPPVEKKDWSKMTAYEKALHTSRQGK